MGFPLRNNIFQHKSSTRRYFARFPIQVAVLFSPSDQEFKKVFGQIFTKLDRLTGDGVAFLPF